MRIFLRSTIACRHRRACFDPLPAGDEHRFRPDQESTWRDLENVARIERSEIRDRLSLRQCRPRVSLALNPGYMPGQIELTSRLRPRNQPPALRRNISMASTRFLTLDFLMMLVM